MPINRVGCSMTRLLCLRLHAKPSGATLDIAHGETGHPFRATIRVGLMLCRKAWRMAPRRTLCARFVTVISLNCRASCRPRGLGVIEMSHDVTHDRLESGLAVDS